MPYNRQSDFFENVTDGRKSTRGNESIKKMAQAGSSWFRAHKEEKNVRFFP
jgi:hypothetical protein